MAIYVAIVYVASSDPPPDLLETIGLETIGLETIGLQMISQ